MEKTENSLEKKAQKMAEGIRLVVNEGKIKILCGEGNYKVYNQPVLIKAFKYAKDVRKATIRVIIGPVISIDNEGRNGLWELKEEGKIEIYNRPQRGSLFHFGVVEKEKDSYSFLDIELPHKCLVPDDERKTPDFENDKEESRFWAEKFNIDFDYWVEEIMKEPPREQIPIKLTDGQIAKFLKVIEDDDKDFNFVDAKDLLEYRNKI